jgi:type I restriction enzyme S subunit
VSWPLVKLEDIFDIARGGSPRPIEQFITKAEDGLNWISIKDASNSEKYITKTKLKIKKEGLVKSRLVKPGDFLLTNSMSFGRPYIMKTTGCIHDGWLVLSGDKERVDQDYFYHLLGSDLLHKKFSSLAAGAVVKNLNISLVKGVEIPLPPLPEQQKIASILDAADNLRQKDQQLIEKYTALSQSLFLEMFGDPVNNQMGWDKRNLQDLVKSVIDCPHTTPNWTSSGKVAIRTSNLTQGGWSWKDKRFVSEEDFHDRSKRGYVKHGDIILSREGTVGVLAIVEMEMEICLGQRLVQLIPDFSLANNYYLLHLLLYELEPERISRIMVGATSKHLNVKELREMSLPVPPIDLQNQFAERIQSIEAQKQLALASLEKSEALFNTLLQRAFKGELTT